MLSQCLSKKVCHQDKQTFHHQPDNIFRVADSDGQSMWSDRHIIGYEAGLNLSNYMGDYSTSRISFHGAPTACRDHWTVL